MEIIIDLTRDDYANFNKYWFYRKGLKMRVIIIIIVAFGMPLLIDGGQEFKITEYLINALFVGFIFGFIYLVGMSIALGWTRKLPSKNGSILGKKRYVITEEGLVEESENNTTLQKWKGIQAIETNNNSIFIFVDNLAAYVIPKRFFSTENEKLDFIKTIEDRIRNAK